MRRVECRGRADLPPPDSRATRQPPARRLVSDLERAVGRLEKNVNARLLAEVLLLDWRKIK
ncbi:MAG: hypothetical protein MUO30_01670 [Anaerolineales bacterium]|nr:hypothetical protein [Anaerolineales bacterium]